MEYDALHVRQRPDVVGLAGSVGSCWGGRRQLSAHGNPQLGSVMAILGALGLRLAVVPAATEGVPAAQAFVDGAEGGEAPAEAEAAPA